MTLLNSFCVFAIGFRVYGVLGIMGFRGDVEMGRPA